MSGAGAFHLLENSEGARITYGNALYYTIVTMSTVGYGDYYPKSVLGKIFIIFFIITSLSIFASYVPEIANILTSRSRYSGNYQKEHGKRHVIVCGDVTTETVDNFLSDFLHKDREENDVEVVFINPHEPDLQMQGLIKRHYTRVEYFIGSVLNPIDLERVKMDSADACLVLANQRCNNPDAEDEANILRVISVKNNCPDVRVVMQILQYHNKGHLFNIPYWNSDRGDDIVCFAELKMGFMAQSCLAPGFSTVISNLFSMRSEMDDNDRLVNWQTLYLRGVAMEIYSDKFSSAFNGMTFTEAALLCKNKLDLLLLAIEVIHPDTDTHFLAINPGPQYRLNEGYLGFFICDTQEQARRAKVFCLKCHSDVRNPHEIKLCSCPLKTKQTVKTYVESAEDLTDQDSVYEQANFEERCHKEITLRVQSANFHRKLNEQDLKHSGPKLFDITGMYHWCEPREFLDACFTSGDDPTFKTLKGHVIVCIFADGRSPLVNLRNFVMPLRASNLDYEELKPIVFLGNSEFLAREWEWMKTFPMVYLMCGSPMSRVLLRSARIDTCGMCVIISAKSELSSKEDPYCIDKEVILCSLNIKSLDFNSKSFIGELFGPGGFASQLCLSDGRMAGSEFNIKSDEISHLSPTVPLLTELHVDGNLQFLDEDDDDAPGMEVYMTQPFACGTAFTESVLDSLVSTAYFNRNALTLIRTLVTGGATPELEKILAEDIGFVGSPVTEEVTNNRCRSRIEQLSMQDSRMSELTLPTTFGKLFNFCLERHSILCLALYRYQDLDSLPVGKDPRRYVLTSPENNFKVAANDLVICVTIFKESGEAAMDKITVPKVNLPKQERPTNQNDLTTLTINTTKC